MVQGLGCGMGVSEDVEPSDTADGQNPALPIIRNIP